MGKIRLGIIMLALPAVLFTTFMRMELKKEQALATALFFLIMWLAFAAGRLVSRFLKSYGALVPFMCTGMAFGVLGIPLYAAVYGVENLGQVSQFAIGHESFVWFIYVTMLKKDFNGEPFGIKTVGNFSNPPSYSPSWPEWRLICWASMIYAVTMSFSRRSLRPWTPWEA